MPGTVPPPDPLQVAHAEQLFSLKEWMVAISGKLDRLEQKLDGKAEIVHVQNLEARLAVVERELVKGAAEKDYLVPQHVRMLEDVGVLKQKAASIASVETYRRWVWGTAFAAVLSIGLTILEMVRA